MAVDYAVHNSVCIQRLYNMYLYKIVAKTTTYSHFRMSA